MASGWRFLGMAGALVLLGAPSPTYAAEQRSSSADAVQGAESAPTTVGQPATRGPSQRAQNAPQSTRNLQSARKHFLRALEGYRRGDYRTARLELERAVVFDPGSKDLQYNLAVVLERLGEYEKAIDRWERYQELEGVPAERKRAQLAIRRLAGVRARQLGSGERPSDRDEGSRGDGPSLQSWAIGSATVAAAALCAGTVLGVRALTLDPDRDASVSGESPRDVAKRAERAHAYAIGADVAFAVGVGAGVAAGLFFFAEPSRDAARRRPLAVGVGWGGEF